ncbi:MAG: DUF5050 domain-containing protein [Clostridiales bacterium]|jgi:hypothetical protein|nr:DUF5050 domain-containing protein [Clostridiales bacterium]
MFLPIGTKINDYTVEKQLTKTKEYCAYELLSPFGKRVLACEFYPDGISIRDMDTGTVAPSQGSEEEFNGRLARFKDKVSTLKSLNMGPLIKVTDETPYDGRNIVFCQIPEGRPLKDYLLDNHGKIPYRQAYELILPLMEALDSMSRYGLFFSIKWESLYVNPFGGMEHSGFFIDDYNVTYIVEDIASVFYQMVAGVSYSDTLNKASQNGAVLPESLDNLLYDVLYSNVSYNSVGEFIIKLRNSVLFDGDMTASQTMAPVNNTYNIDTPAVFETDIPVENGQTLDANNVGGVQGKEVIVEEALTDPLVKPQTEAFDMKKGQAPYSAPGQSPYINNNGPNPSGFPQNPPYGHMPPPKKSGNKVLVGCLLGGCLSFIIIAGIITFILFRVGVTAQREFAESGSVSEFAAQVEDEIGQEIAKEYGTDSQEYQEYSEGIDTLDEAFDPKELMMSGTYAFLSYENMEIAYNDTVVMLGDYIYFRGYTEDNGWGLAKAPANDPKAVEFLTTGVMPAFMDITDSNIYYADAMDDYSIYKIALEGGEPEQINNTRSAYINYLNGYIYYVNLEDYATIYRIDETTLEPEKINDFNSEYLSVYNDKIYYANYDPDMGIEIYAYDTLSGTDGIISSHSPMMLEVKDNNIYFNDDTGHMNIIGLDGSQSISNGDLFDTDCFDVSGEFIYYLDYETYELCRYNMNTKESENLGIEAVYFQVIGNNVYYYEYYDEFLHYYNIDTGDYSVMYDGFPVYADVETK